MIFSPGGSEVYNQDRKDRKEILEFNHESKSWNVIGAMKEKRSVHAVSVVQLKEYEKWCN